MAGLKIRDMFKNSAFIEREIRRWNGHAAKQKTRRASSAPPGSPLTRKTTSQQKGEKLNELSQITAESVKAALASERLNLQFKASTGDAQIAAREIDYVRVLSNQLGLSFNETATAYSKFLAATRNTPIEGEPARKVFEGVSKAVTALGLSTEQADGIFLALTQMMSKGKVSAEELTGQLGERLPRALQLAADALGLTTTQLMKQMQEGKIMSSELLPKLAEQLEKTYGKAAEDAATKGQAGFNRFKNEVELTAASLGSMLLPPLEKAAETAAALLKTLRESGSTKVVRDGFELPEDDRFVNNNKERAGATLDPQMARIEADRRSRQADDNKKRAATEKKAAEEANKKKSSTATRIVDGTGLSNRELDIREKEAITAEGKELDRESVWKDTLALPDQVNPYGKMTDDQQAAFDQRAMISYREARNATLNRGAAEVADRLPPALHGWAWCQRQ